MLLLAPPALIPYRYPIRVILVKTVHSPRYLTLLGLSVSHIEIHLLNIENRRILVYYHAWILVRLEKGRFILPGGTLGGSPSTSEILEIIIDGVHWLLEVVLGYLRGFFSDLEGGSDLVGSHLPQFG